MRVGPILGIPAVLSDLGVSPQRALTQAGIDPQLFDDPENRIGLEALGLLFENCVALIGCAHFGLLVGERFELQGLGPLGSLLRNSATVGDAIGSLVLHLHLHDRGAAPMLLAPDLSCVMLGYSVCRHGTPALTQIQDAAIGYGILAELCGPAWKPLRVQFAHARPSNIAAYQRLFRSDVSFEAEVSGLVFASSSLKIPINGADAARHEFLVAAIRGAEDQGPMHFAELVERMLPQMVLSGMASGKAVASLLAVHERTLRRRLEAEGKNLQQLINQVRFELAKQLLENTALSVAAIATALSYSDANAFSWAFRTWATLSPTQWRAKA